MVDSHFQNMTIFAPRVLLKRIKGNILKRFFQSKGIWIPLSILVVTTLLFLTVYKPGHMGKSGIASQSDSPAIQTGKAFEVIE